MLTRQSARNRGIDDKNIIPDSIIGRRRPRNTSTETTNMSDDFSFRRKKVKLPTSEPVHGSKKIVAIPPQAVTDEEEVIPLTKDEMLRILSKEMPMCLEEMLRHHLDQEH